MKHYPEERKQAILAKMLPPHNMSVSALSQAEGISKQTQYTWRTQAKSRGEPVPGPISSIDDWSSEAKLAAVVETASLSEHELGEYCRRRGVYPDRLHQCGLALHPFTAEIVYCQDANRKETGEEKHFDFLGYCFRPRLSRNRNGKYFVNFFTAISPKSKKAIYSEISEWQLHRRTGSMLRGLARFINPIVRGWIEYFGAFFKAESMFLVGHLEKKLIRWVLKKYKKQGANYKRAAKWLKRVREKLPKFFFTGVCFVHDLSDKRRMNREVHVRFCERLEGRFVLPTRPTQLKCLWFD